MDIRIGQQLNSAIFAATRSPAQPQPASAPKTSATSLTVSTTPAPLPGETISGVSQSQIDAAMVRDDDLGKALKGVFNFPAPPMSFPAE